MSLLFQLIIGSLFAVVLESSSLKYLYRLYNRNMQQPNDYFYTTNFTEATAVAKSGYLHEGIIGYIATESNENDCHSLVPLYRFRNIADSSRFYTTNSDEVQSRVDKNEFESEGIAGYCASKHNDCGASLRLHMLFVYGAHLYTTNEAEAQGVKNSAGNDTYRKVVCHLWPTSSTKTHVESLADLHSKFGSGHAKYRGLLPDDPITLQQALGQSHFKAKDDHATNVIDLESMKLSAFDVAFPINNSHYQNCRSFTIGPYEKGSLTIVTARHCAENAKVNDILVVSLVSTNKYAVYRIKDIKSAMDLVITLDLVDQSSDQSNSKKFEKIFKLMVPHIEAEPYSQPWMVELIASYGYDRFEHCNGILLEEKRQQPVKSGMLVLTSAACLYNESEGLENVLPTKVMLRFGTHDSAIAEENELEDLGTYYSGTTFNKDQPLMKDRLILLHIKKGAFYTNYVRSIRILADDDPSGLSTCFDECFIAGWRTPRGNECKTKGTYLGLTYIEWPNDNKFCPHEVLTVLAPLKSRIDRWSPRPCPVDVGTPVICHIPATDEYVVRTFVSEYVIPWNIDDRKISYVAMSSNVYPWMNEFWSGSTHTFVGRLDNEDIPYV